MKKLTLLFACAMFAMQSYSQSFIIRLGIKPETIIEDARKKNYDVELLRENSSNFPAIGITFPERVEMYVLKSGTCVKQVIVTSDECEAGKLLLNMYSFLMRQSFTHVFYGMWNGKLYGEPVTVTYIPNFLDENGLHTFSYLFTLKY